MSKLLSFLLSLFIACFFLLPHNISAEEKIEVDLQKSFDKIKNQFDIFQSEINLNKIDVKQLDGAQKEYSTLEQRLEECISTKSTQLKDLQENLKLLGEVQSSEELDIRKKRQDFEKQSQDVDNDLKRCNLLKIQLKKIADDLSSQRLELLKKQLLSNENNLWNSVKALAKSPQPTTTGTSRLTIISEKLSRLNLWAFLLLIAAGTALGVMWKRYTNFAPINSGKYSSPTLIAAVRGVRRTSHVLFSLILILLYVNTQDSSDSALTQTLKFTILICFAFALIRGVVSPERSLALSANASNKTILTLAWSTILFSTIAFALSHAGLGRFSGSILQYLSWLVTLSLAAISFVILLWISIHNFLKKRSFTPATLIPMGMIVVSVIAAAIGYRNLSYLLYFGTLLSIITFLFTYLLLRISSEFFDSLDQGKLSWQNKLRTVMSIEKDRAFPGVIWLRILFFFIVAFFTVSTLLHIWGSSQQSINTLISTVKNGFTIGNINLDLSSIALALLIIIITLSTLPFIKNNLVSGWLKHSNLSRGAKEATQTLVGYVLGAIATLWALLVLGVNFQNLAIIAGALSVGIGFGLQNIVNNFVSGLILLFERPIRRGDWVAVGTTEGYVRDISIRSTTIQTFDRADVIVPNSELISNQVTNWMLSNNVGRLVAPIGVAYGSDVEKVIEILKNIAGEHPDIIADQANYRVRVLFLEFGDNSLNFQLRCYVRNVDDRILILSDVNLSIDREFRKAGIEVPFPQRVVHLQKEDKDVDENKDN